MEPYLDTAFQFCQPAGDDSKGEEGEDKVETDVEVLKSTLSTLRKQQNAIKGIKDSRSIAFFKVAICGLKYYSIACFRILNTYLRK